jgi:hypothetical protein
MVPIHKVRTPIFGSQNLGRSTTRGKMTPSTMTTATTKFCVVTHRFHGALSVDVTFEELMLDDP